MSIFIRTSSAASWGSWSTVSAQRNSITRFWPSMWSRSRRPARSGCRTAANPTGVGQSRWLDPRSSADAHSACYSRGGLIALVPSARASTHRPWGCPDAFGPACMSAPILACSCAFRHPTCPCSRPRHGHALSVPAAGVVACEARFRPPAPCVAVVGGSSK